MKRLFAICIMLFFIITIAFSQEESSSNEKVEQQWEYLVVSFGKTLFDTPEKMMAYKALGLDNGNESISLQSNLDILGRFGWDLVDSLGSIGGDQQLILKRIYIKERTANEYGLIQNGKELYLKDLKDIIERSLKLAEEQKKIEEEKNNKPKLIDIDQVERMRAQEELRQKIETNYRKKFEQTEMAKYSTISFSKKNFYTNDITIIIEIDLTEKYLINGNSYHGDLVNKYVEQCIESYKYRDSLMERYAGISISGKGYIKFNGENVLVTSHTQKQSYAGSPWTL